MSSMSKNTSICISLISASFLFLCILASGLAVTGDGPSNDDNVTYVYINNGETFEVNLSFGGLAPNGWDLNDFDNSYVELVTTTTWQDPAIAGCNDSYEQMIWKFKGLKDGETQLRFDADLSHEGSYSEIFIVTIGQGSNQIGTDNTFREADSGACLHFDTGEEFVINFTWGEEDGYFFSDILFDHTTLELENDVTIGPFGNTTTGLHYYRIWTFKAMQNGKTTLQFMRADTEVYNYTIYVGTVTVADMTEEKAPGFELPLLIAVLAVVAIIGWKGRF